MQRARTATLATLGVALILALTGCRSSPETAAYVGSTTYSVSSVDKLAGEVRGNTNVDRPSPAEIATMYVFRDLARQVAKEKGWQVQKLDRASAAQSLGLKPDSQYLDLRAEVEELSNVLLTKAEPVTPSEAELRDVFERASAAGLVQPGQTFESIRNQIDGPQLRSALGARKLLVEAAKRSHVTVNPLYGHAEWPLLTFSGGKPAVVVPLTATPAGDPVVVPAS
jgi:hypothetical protein